MFLLISQDCWVCNQCLKNVCKDYVFAEHLKILKNMEKGAGDVG